MKIFSRLSQKGSLKKSIWLILIVCISTGWIQGCATSSDTAAREKSLKTFQADLIARTQSHIPEEPLDLQTCIRIAMENNLEVKTAQIQGELAGLDRKTAFSSFLPRIELGLSHTTSDKHQQRKAMGSFIPLADRAITYGVINAQLPVFAPETWFLYSAYSRGEEIQHLVTLRVRQLIRLQVTALYFACLSIEDAKPAIAASLEGARQLYKEVEAAWREGLVLKSQLEEAKTYRMLWEQALEKNRRLNTQTRVELLEAMGLYPIHELMDVKLEQPQPAVLLEGDLAEQVFQALVNRPEMAISDKTLAVSKDATLMAIAAFLPKVLLVGNFTYNSDSFLRYSNLWTGGITGILTAFDGFANIHRYQEAKQYGEKAVVEREAACLKIILEVVRARNQMDNAEDELALAVQRLKAARSLSEEQDALWREGLLTASEKLDAAGRYAQARANHGIAQYQYQVAAATLNDVIGSTGKEADSE